jgi:type IV pilus assembly protein PilA
MKKKESGFSLIELLIVVAIILIIAAIAIPNLLRSRMAANQASAVGSLRTLNTSEVTYATTYPAGFTADLVSLGPPASGSNPTSAAAGLIDSVLAAGVKSGYTFSYATTAVLSRYDTYTLNASPTTAGTTGTNFYFTDQTGVIRQNSTVPAAASDSPIGG